MNHSGKILDNIRRLLPHLASVFGIGVFFAIAILQFFVFDSHADNVSLVFDFNTSTDYTFISTTTEVTGGIASLKFLDQTDDDNDIETGFGAGVFSDTEFSTDHLELDATGKTNGVGTFTSRVIDAGTSTSWSTLSWTQPFPYGKPAPNSDGVETGYTDGNLNMSSNVLLYHMENSSGNTDNSGNGHNGTPTSIVYSQSGKVGNAYGFNGTSSRILVANTPDINTNGTALQERTILAWVNADDFASGKHVVYEEGGGTRGLNIYFDGSTFYVGGWNTTASESNWAGTWLSDTSLTTGTWHHVALRLDVVGTLATEANTFQGFLDGEEFASGAGGALYSRSGDINIGRNGNTKFHSGTDNSAGEYFDGRIDEFIIFNKALTDEEILDHYRRGALKLRLQARTCDDFACDTEDFVGPGGSTSTYFGDENNTTLLPPTGQSLAGVVTDNRYFQYKATFETISTTISSELEDVSVSPNHYYGGNTFIVNNTGQTFTSLFGFSHVLGGGNAGNVNYQISNNGTDYYYVSSSTWTTATNTSQFSDVDTVSSSISNFVSQIGDGDFFFKALFESDTTQAVELDEVTLVYEEVSCGNGVVDSGEACDDGNVLSGDGCSSTCTVESSGSGGSGGSGGGGGGTKLPAEAFLPPEIPEGGFGIEINKGSSTTSLREVTLDLQTGEDVTSMAISLDETFLTSKVEDFVTPYGLDLCQGKEECKAGKYNVYVIFYTQYGQKSDIVSSSIFYEPEEQIVLIPKEEEDALDREDITEFIFEENVINESEVININEEEIIFTKEEEILREEAKLNLQNVKQNLDDSQKRLNNKEIVTSGELNEIEDQILSIASELGFDMSPAFAEDNPTPAKRISNLKAVYELILEILVDNRAPVSKTYFTFGSFVINNLLINPTKVSVDFPVSISLPQEVSPKNILNSGNFETTFSVLEDIYVAKDVVTLEPGEVKKNKIVLRDVWQISIDLLDDFRFSVGERTRLLKGTKSYAEAKEIRENVFRNLTLMEERQREKTDLDPTKHVLNYRINKKQLSEVEENILRLAELLEEENIDKKRETEIEALQQILNQQQNFQKNTTSAIYIVVVITFLGFLLSTMLAFSMLKEIHYNKQPLFGKKVSSRSRKKKKKSVSKKVLTKS